MNQKGGFNGFEKALALLVGLMAVASPFFAQAFKAGEFSQRLLTIESKAAAAEVEIRGHEEEDNRDRIQMASTISRIQADLTNQSRMLRDIHDTLTNFKTNN